MLTELCLYNP